MTCSTFGVPVRLPSFGFNHTVLPLGLQPLGLEVQKFLIADINGLDTSDPPGVTVEPLEYVFFGLDLHCFEYTLASCHYLGSGLEESTLIQFQRQSSEDKDGRQTNKSGQTQSQTVLGVV